MKLAKPFYTVAEISEGLGGPRKGWSHKRTKLVLLRMNREANGMLLRPSPGQNRKYIVARDALKQFMPGLFDEPENAISDLESQLERLQDLARDAVIRLEAAEKEIRSLRYELHRATTRRPSSSHNSPTPAPSP